MAKEMGKSAVVGLWSDEEHAKFIEGILVYGKKWKNVTEHIGTRSYDQVKRKGNYLKFELEKGKLFDYVGKN